MLISPTESHRIRPLSIAPRGLAFSFNIARGQSSFGCDHPHELSEVWARPAAGRKSRSRTASESSRGRFGAHRSACCLLRGKWGRQDGDGWQHRKRRERKRRRRRSLGHRRKRLGGRSGHGWKRLRRHCRDRRSRRGRQLGIWRSIRRLRRNKRARRRYRFRRKRERWCHRFRRKRERWTVRKRNGRVRGHWLGRLQFDRHGTL